MGWKQIPSTPQQVKARDELFDWATEDLQYPKLSIIPLTQLERANQMRLSEYGQQDQDVRALASDQVEATLGGAYNPMTSPFWQGYRDYSEQNKEGDVNAMRRFAQRGGMLNSTPGQFAEAGVRRRANAQSETQLGQLYENERGRQLGVAQSEKQAATGNLLQSQQMAAQERQILQAEVQAQYEQILNTMLAPYIYQSPLLQSIINEQRFYYKQKSSGTNWGQIAGAIAGVVGAPFTGGASLAATAAGGISSFASSPGMMPLSSAAELGNAWLRPQGF